MTNDIEARGSSPSDDVWHDESTYSTLIRRARDGQEDAWIQLVHRYGSFTYNQCRMMGLSPEEAADVTQETFLATYDSLHRFRREGESDSFRKWLRAVTRNKVRDFYRRRQKQLAQAEGGTELKQRLQRVAATNSPTNHSTSSSSTQLVRQALAIIEDDFRKHTWTAFWRTAIDEQPASRVAEELGLTPDAVRQAKSRVLKRLREELDRLQNEA